MSRTDLERQVAAALASHAEGLAVRPRPFEPVRPPLDLGDGDPAAAPSSGRRPLRLAVAAAALVAVGLATVVTRSGDGDEAQALTVAGVPDEALFPAWAAPPGWELSNLDWGRDPAEAIDPVETAGTALLLGEQGADGRLGRALLVEVNAGGAIDEDGERTTVRGKPGRAEPDWRDPDATALSWDEEVGVHVRASYRGMSTSEAVAVLDALTVPPGGLAAGFDLPAGDLPGGLVLLDEAARPEPGGAATGALAMFGPPQLDDPAEEFSPDMPYKAVVATVPASGEPTPDYLTAWFVAGRDDDGVARWWTRAEDGNPGFLRTLGPDGSSVRVSIDTEAVAADGLGDPQDVARQIAESVAPATSERLSGLWDDLIARWVARDLVVAVPTPAGTVELRGRGSETVLCLRDGEALSCETAARPNSNNPPDGEDYDGQWTATLPTDNGERLVAVSDQGPILVEVRGAGGEGETFTYPDAQVGEADGSWAAVALAEVGEHGIVAPVTDVEREAEACLNMLAEAPTDPSRGGPEQAERIRSEGGGPAAMYRACRELEIGSWYRDVGP